MLSLQRKRRRRRRILWWAGQPLLLLLRMLTRPLTKSGNQGQPRAETQQPPPMFCTGALNVVEGVGVAAAAGCLAGTAH